MTTKEIVSVCGRCDKDKQKEKEAKENWLRISHVLCPECYEIQMEIIDKMTSILETNK